MNQTRSVIVVYNDSLRSHLWLCNGKYWFLFPLEEGSDAHADLEEGFTNFKLSYNELPEDLRENMEVEDFNQDIKVIYSV